MRRIPWTVGLVGALVAVSLPAAADPPSTWTVASAVVPAPSPAPAPAGLAVVAMAGATDAAWPLAQAVYADPALRAATIDEAHARVLCGEPAPAGAPSEVRDLADTVAAVRGEDAPSRALLADIARRFSVRGVVVVRIESGRASARVFLADAGAFDGATYAPDDGPKVAWSSARQSLARAFGAPTASSASAAVPAPASVPPSTQAPPLATHEGPRIENTPPHTRRFYESGWFWGALGAAAFAGGAFYFATRDTSPSTIHLGMQVPH
jgi:hypothetical protein